MAGVGQQALVRAQQRFDARGRAIEARAERGHLVLPVLGHALVQRALAESFDAELERFKPARQPAHHGPGARRHSHEEQQQQQGQPHAVGQHAQGQQRGRIAQRTTQRAAAPAPQPWAQHPQRAAIVQTHRLRALRRAFGFAPRVDV